MTAVRVVLCTCPPGDAERIARELVARRLVACVNEVPGVVSTYRWEGEVARENETLLIAKTDGARVPALIEALRALHPYDVPEILALPVDAGDAAYVDWVRRESAD